ncbi:MAG: radical SAM protein [Candidatus Saccharicenans sp.]
MKQPELPFDPLSRSAEVEALVMTGQKRRYYRFRAGGFYGGIITADTVGCNFLCAYCWNYRRNLAPEGEGQFYSPEEVAENIIKLARKTSLRQARVSGAEPILGEASFRHLLDLLVFLREKLPDLSFVLETNGFILGREKGLCRELARVRGIEVRVCLKATDRDKFQTVTGARREGFLVTLEALNNLKKYGVKCWAAINQDLFEAEELARFRRLLAVNYGCAELELEQLMIYPFVADNLSKRGIRLKTV